MSAIAHQALKEEFHGSVPRWQEKSWSPAKPPQSIITIDTRGRDRARAYHNASQNVLPHRSIGLCGSQPEIEIDEFSSQPATSAISVLTWLNCQ